MAKDESKKTIALFNKSIEIDPRFMTHTFIGRLLYFKEFI